LRRSRDEARRLLDAQIDKGNELAGRITPALYSHEAADRVRNERRRWSSFNDELLRSMFDSPEVADGCSWFAPISFGSVYKDPVQDFMEIRESVEESVNRLQTVVDKLELYELAPEAPEPEAVPAATARAPRPGTVINITNSTFGAMTAGDVLGSIRAHVSSLSGTPSADAFREAVKAFAAEVANETALSEQQRKEVLEDIDFVTKGANQPEGERPVGPMKAMIAAIPAALETSTRLLGAWDQYGPAIKAHVGL
jgi:hypothetical protein